MDDFDKVFAALNKQRPDGLYVIAVGGVMRPNRKRIAGFVIKSRLPSVYGNREIVEAGGLMSYRADETDSYRRVAVYVDKILKGTKPADLPVEQPTKFELVINLKRSIDHAAKRAPTCRPLWGRSLTFDEVRDLKRTVNFALKSRLPSVGSNREYVDAGGLMSYDADPADGYRRAATYVDKILKGAKPAELPVQQP